MIPSLALALSLTVGANYPRFGQGQQLDGGMTAWPVECTNCGAIVIDGGVTISAGAVTIDGGILGSLVWLDGGWVNATVTNTITTNLTNVASQPVDIGSAPSGAGTQRVVLATNSVTRLWDSTNSMVLAGANAAPTNAQPAMVVAVSPNSQLYIDSGTIDARVTNFPATQVTTGTVTVDGGVLGSLVWLDGGWVNATVSNAFLLDGTFTARINTLGQKTMANSTPVVIASDQGALSVTANAGTNLNTSALALDATLTNRAQKTQLTDGTRDGTIKAGSTATTAADTSYVVALSPNSPVPAGTNVIGHVIADTGSTTAVTGSVAVTESGTWTVQPGNTANTTPWLTTDTPRTVSSANNTGTCTSVAASTTVLASNASRRAYGFKASEANTDRVYCKLGATATTSNMPFGAGAAWSQDTGAVYTGVVDCIAGSGTQTVCVFEFN